MDTEYTGSWKACEAVPCKGEETVIEEPPVEACLKPHYSCSPVFDYKPIKKDVAITFSGCTVDDAELDQHGVKMPWCSQDRTFANNYQPCKEVPCQDCYVRNILCASEFTYKG